MKKMVFMLALLLLVSSSFAQDFIGIGVRGGLAIPGIQGMEEMDSNYDLGFTAGGFISYQINENFSIQQEFLYITKGFSAESEMLEEISTSENIKTEICIEQRLNYVELPLLLVFSVTENLSIYQGGYMDLYLNGTYKNETTTTTNTLEDDAWIAESVPAKESGDVETGDLKSPGWGLTTGFDYAIGNLSIGARYSLGLTNVLENDDTIYKHNIFKVLLGYSF